MKKYIALTIIYLACAFPTHAQYISEIMYDPPGADARREWIEIYTDTEIQLATLRFIENNIRHTVKGNIASIPAGSYVVIADNVDSFMIDHPQYNGIVLDSAFSLSNTGEQLLLEVDGVIVDDVTYEPVESPSTEEEFSLQIIDGQWIYALSTPGVINQVSASSQSNNSSDSSSSSSSPATKKTSTDNTQFEASKKIHTRKVQDVSIGRDRIGYPQVPLSFEILTKDGLYEKDKVRWSFGDGHSKKGTRVHHAYAYPGIYVVTATIIGKTDAGISRTIVNVLEHSVSVIQHSDKYVMLHNAGKEEVNIGGMYIDFGNDQFKIPANTIILPLSTITIPIHAMILRRDVDLSNPVLTVARR